MSHGYCTVFQLPAQARNGDATRTRLPDLLLAMARKRGCQFASSISNLVKRISVGDDPATLASLWQSEIQQAGLQQGPAIAGVRFWFEHDPDLDLDLAVLLPEYRQLLVRIEDSFISSPDQWNRARLDTLLDLNGLVFARTEAEYGYGLIPEDSYPYPWYDLSRGVQAIYDYNFLGPALVQRMGEVSVRSIPAWRQRELDGGGFLLEMTSNPILETTDYYERAAEFLEVSDVYRGGEPFATGRRQPWVIDR